MWTFLLGMALAQASSPSWVDELALGSTGSEPASELLRGACASGDGDLEACAEQGWAMWSGRGPWPSRRRARRLAELSCGADVLRGCVLQAAMDAAKRPRAAWDLALDTWERGGLEAARVLYVIDPLGSLPYAASSCDAGVAEACVDWAREQSPADAHGRLRWSCELGLDDACVRAALADPAMDRPARVDALQALCDADIPWACAEARWLRQGSPADPAKTSGLGVDQARMALEEALPWMRDCVREALDEGSPAQGRLDFDLWGDGDGILRGLAWAEDPTGTLSACLADAVVGRRALPLARHAQRGRTSLVVDPHTALQVLPDHADDTYVAQRLRDVVGASWGQRAERCYLDHGGRSHDRVFAIVDTLFDRDGALRRSEWFERTGLDEVDACLLALVREAPPLGLLEGKTQLAVRFDFGAIDLRW